MPKVMAESNVLSNYKSSPVILVSQIHSAKVSYFAIDYYYFSMVSVVDSADIRSNAGYLSPSLPQHSRYNPNNRCAASCSPL